MFFNGYKTNLHHVSIYIISIHVIGLKYWYNIIILEPKYLLPEKQQSIIQSPA